MRCIAFLSVDDDGNEEIVVTYTYSYRLREKLLGLLSQQNIPFKVFGLWGSIWPAVALSKLDRRILERIGWYDRC